MSVQDTAHADTQHIEEAPGVLGRSVARPERAPAGSSQRVKRDSGLLGRDAREPPCPGAVRERARRRCDPCPKSGFAGPAAAPAAPAAEPQPAAVRAGPPDHQPAAGPARHLAAAPGPAG